VRPIRIDAGITLEGLRRNSWGDVAIGKLRVAVVGCGFAANHHANAWRKNGGKVLAACDIAEEKAKHFASKHKIPFHFTSTDEMLQKAKPDVVSVCTPPQTHKQVVLDVVRAGINAFVEKPLALNYSDALEIVNEAKARGVKLWVTRTYLFTPTMMKAKKLVDGGAIGRLNRADLMVYAPREVILGADGGWLSSLPGGAFGEVLPHPIYIIQRFLGRLQLISAEFRRLSNSSWMSYDSLHVLLRGERGLGRIIVCYNALDFDMYLLVEGDRGVLIVNPLGKIVAKLGSSAKYLRNLFSLKPYLLMGLEWALGKLTRDPLVQNIKIFVQHIERGTPLDPDLDFILNLAQVYDEVLHKVR